MAAATSDSTFKTDVIEETLPVLVDFWAPWCGPCKALGPVMDELSKEVEGKAKVYKINVDENPVKAREYGITSIPAVFIFQGGEVKEKLIGMRPKETYMEALGL